MMKEEKKESFFKKLFWFNNSNKVSNIDKKSVIDFDSWINMVESFIAEKNWKKAMKVINKIRKLEKKDISSLFKNSSEEQKEIIKKAHLNKLNGLLDYEKNIEDSIRNAKEEKKSNVINEKINYIKNRLDYYIKSENYKKALEVLNSFYEKYRDEEKVVDFYNKEKKLFETLQTPKKTFFWRLFWKKEEKISSDIKESEKKEELNDKVKIQDEIQTKIKTENENIAELFWSVEEKKNNKNLENSDVKFEENKESNKDDIIGDIEVKDIKNIDSEKKEENNKIEEKKNTWFFSKLFWWNKESKKINNTDKEIELNWEIQKDIIETSKDEIKDELKVVEEVLINESKIDTKNVKNEELIIDDKKTEDIIQELNENNITENSQENYENNENIEEKLVNSEVKEEKTLWISELRKNIGEEKNNNWNDNPLKIESLESKDNDLEKVEEVKLWIEKLSQLPIGKSINNNEEENNIKWNQNNITEGESSKDNLVINDQNKDEIKWFFGKLFNKDAKNLDKVVNLMESFMKIKDLDKAISAVEAVKNIEWKNVVIQEEESLINKNTQINENLQVTNNNLSDINKTDLENKNNALAITETKEGDLKLESKSIIWWIFSKNEGQIKEQNKINVEEIKDFDWAIKWINYFINVKDFERAKSWLEEVKIKEEKAFNALYEKIDLEKEKSKQKDIYHKKLVKIEKLSEYLENEEIAYKEEKEEEKFKIKFVQIKNKLEELIWSKKYYEALDLVNSFFEENKNSVIVINFFNKRKSKIQKSIKKQEAQKEKDVSKNAKREAEILIWENINLWNENTTKNKNNDKKSGVSFFSQLLEKLNLYKKIKLKLKEKRLVDEVTLLIESQNEVDEMAKKSRLEHMHMWLIKELDNDRLLGYDLYAKILWKDKISGDTFWFVEDNATYKFFLWDATWHWIQAWLIVTLLTRLFYNFSKENFLEKLVFEVNNWLKQDLKSWNFITWIFFEVDKTNLNSMKYVWMWHEPILIFRKKTMDVEKYIAWWLAAWIRIISDINHIKTNNIKLDDWDIVFLYSDWIVESRNKDNELLWVNWLSEIVKKSCMNFIEWKITDIYNSIMEDVKTYRWWSANFFDDASIFILKRNTNKDIMDKKSMYLKDLSVKEWLTKKNIKELEWKTKVEIEKELQKIRKEKQMKLILNNLEKLYITWEILKLKQESIRYIKEWFIHKKINRFLKKAITNERKYKIDLKDQKMKSRYIVLKELLKKWAFSTVISECNEIIASDWNITI